MAQFEVGFGTGTASNKINGNYVNLPRLTSAERDALTGIIVGTLIENTTTGLTERYSGSSWQALSLAGTGFVQNGNSFGANAVLGTNDNFNLSFETNGVVKGTFDTDGGLNLFNLATDRYALSITNTVDDNNYTKFTGSGVEYLLGFQATRFLVKNNTTNADLISYTHATNTLSLGSTTAANQNVISLFNSNAGYTTASIGLNSTRKFFYSDGSTVRLWVKPTNVIATDTANYETLVVANNDIPNRKFVIDSLATVPTLYTSDGFVTVNREVTFEDGTLTIFGTGTVDGWISSLKVNEYNGTFREGAVGLFTAISNGVWAGVVGEDESFEINTKASGFGYKNVFVADSSSLRIGAINSDGTTNGSLTFGNQGTVYTENRVLASRYGIQYLGFGETSISVAGSVSYDNLQFNSLTPKKYVDDQISLVNGGSVAYLSPVISQTNNPPVSPAIGDRYLVGTVPTGAWVGNANRVAEWDGSVWQYTIPVANNVVFVTNTLTTLRYNGTSWVSYQGTALLQNGNTLGVSVSVGTNDANPLLFKVAGVDRFRVASSGVQLQAIGFTGSASLPLFTTSITSGSGLWFTGANGTCVSGGGTQVAQFNGGGGTVNYLNITSSTTGNPINIGVNGTDLNISVNHTTKGTGSHIFTTNSLARVTIESDGTLSANTANYENLITSNNDFVNKKFVDDNTLTTDREQSHTAGATVTISDSKSVLYVDPASNLTSLTITMPSSPINGQEVKISFGGTITSGSVVTALTLSGNTGQTILAGSTITSAVAGDGYVLKYQSSGARWRIF